MEGGSGFRSDSRQDGAQFEACLRRLNALEKKLTDQVQVDIAQLRQKWVQLRVDRVTHNTFKLYQVREHLNHSKVLYVEEEQILDEFHKVKEALLKNSLDDETFEATRETCMVLGGKLGNVRQRQTRCYNDAADLELAINKDIVALKFEDKDFEDLDINQVRASTPVRQLSPTPLERHRSRSREPSEFRMPPMKLPTGATTPGGNHPSDPHAYFSRPGSSQSMYGNQKGNIDAFRAAMEAKQADAEKDDSDIQTDKMVLRSASGQILTKSDQDSLLLPEVFSERPGSAMSDVSIDIDFTSRPGSNLDYFLDDRIKIDTLQPKMSNESYISKDVLLNDGKGKHKEAEEDANQSTIPKKIESKIIPGNNITDMKMKQTLKEHKNEEKSPTIYLTGALGPEESSKNQNAENSTNKPPSEQSTKKPSKDNMMKETESNTSSKELKGKVKPKKVSTSEFDIEESKTIPNKDSLNKSFIEKQSKDILMNETEIESDNEPKGKSKTKKVSKPEFDKEDSEKITDNETLNKSVKPTNNDENSKKEKDVPSPIIATKKVHENMDSIDLDNQANKTQSQQVSDTYESKNENLGNNDTMKQIKDRNTKGLERKAQKEEIIKTKCEKANIEKIKHASEKVDSKMKSIDKESEETLNVDIDGKPEKNIRKLKSTNKKNISSKTKPENVCNKSEKLAEFDPQMGKQMDGRISVEEIKTKASLDGTLTKEDLSNSDEAKMEADEKIKEKKSLNEERKVIGDDKIDKNILNAEKMKKKIDPKIKKEKKKIGKLEGHSPPNSELEMVDIENIQKDYNIKSELKKPSNLENTDDKKKDLIKSTEQSKDGAELQDETLFKFIDEGVKRGENVIGNTYVNEDSKQTCKNLITKQNFSSETQIDIGETPSIVPNNCTHIPDSLLSTDNSNAMGNMPHLMAAPKRKLKKEKKDIPNDVQAIIKNTNLNDTNLNDLQDVKNYEIEASDPINIAKELFVELADATKEASRSRAIEDSNNEFMQSEPAEWDEEVNEDELIIILDNQDEKTNYNMLSNLNQQFEETHSMSNFPELETVEEKLNDKTPRSNRRSLSTGFSHLDDFEKRLAEMEQELDKEEAKITEREMSEEVSLRRVENSWDLSPPPSRALTEEERYAEDIEAKLSETEDLDTSMKTRENDMLTFKDTKLETAIAMEETSNYEYITDEITGQSIKRFKKVSFASEDVDTKIDNAPSNTMFIPKESVMPVVPNRSTSKEPKSKDFLSAMTGGLIEPGKSSIGSLLPKTRKSSQSRSRQSSRQSSKDRSSQDLGSEDEGSKRSVDYDSASEVFSESSLVTKLKKLTRRKQKVQAADFDELFARGMALSAQIGSEEGQEHLLARNEELFKSCLKPSEIGFNEKVLSFLDDQSKAESSRSLGNILDSQGHISRERVKKKHSHQMGQNDAEKTESMTRSVSTNQRKRSREYAKPEEIKLPPVPKRDLFSGVLIPDSPEAMFLQRVTDFVARNQSGYLQKALQNSHDMKDPGHISTKPQTENKETLASKPRKRSPPKIKPSPGKSFLDANVGEEIFGPSIEEDCLNGNSTTMNMSKIECNQEMNSPTQDSKYRDHGEPADKGLPKQLMPDKLLANEDFYENLRSELTTPEVPIQSDFETSKKYSHHLGRAEYGTLRKRSTSAMSRDTSIEKATYNIQSKDLSAEPGIPSSVKLSETTKEPMRSDSRTSDYSNALPDLEVDSEIAIPDLNDGKVSPGSIMRTQSLTFTVEQDEKVVTRDTTEEVLAIKAEALKEIADRRQQIRDTKAWIQNGLMTVVGFGVMAYLQTLEAVAGGQ